MDLPPVPLPAVKSPPAWGGGGGVRREVAQSLTPRRATGAPGARGTGCRIVAAPQPRYSTHWARDHKSCTQPARRSKRIASKCSQAVICVPSGAAQEPCCACASRLPLLRAVAASPASPWIMNCLRGGRGGRSGRAHMWPSVAGVQALRFNYMW